MSALIDEEENFGLSDVFTCEDYVEKVWRLHDIEQRLLCSNMSSTGCGLAGFFAARYCRAAHITDGNEVVIRLLDRNLKHLSTESTETTVGKFVWGLQEPVFDLVRTHMLPDLMIGADVILWPQFTHPLLSSIRWLLRIRFFVNSVTRRQLSLRHEVCAYISYVERATTTTDLFYTLCTSLGLNVAIIPKNLFLPAESADVTPDLLKLDRYLFQITLSTSEQGVIRALVDQHIMQISFAEDDSCVEDAICDFIMSEGGQTLRALLVDDCGLGSGDDIFSTFMMQSEAPF